MSRLAEATMHSRSDADHVVRAFVPWAPPRVRRRVTHRLAGPCRFQGTLREKRALKQQIAALEGENVRLKSSVYELSWRLTSVLDHVAASRASHLLPADLRMLPASLVGAARSDQGGPSPTHALGQGRGPLPTPSHGSAGHGSGPFAPAARDWDGPSAQPNHRARMDHMRTLRHHHSAVYDCAFSPSGELLATASFDKTYRIVRTADPAMSATTMRGHAHLVSCLAFTSDSAHLCTGSFDRTCRVVDVSTSAEVARADTQGCVQDVCADAGDGTRFFAASTCGSVAVLDSRTRRTAAALHVGVSATAVHAPSPGRLLLTGDTSGRLAVWDLRTLRQVKEATVTVSDNRPITGLCGLPGGADGSSESADRLVAANCYDDRLHLFHLHGTGLATPKSLLWPLRAVGGLHNEGWPIRASLFRGPAADAQRASAALLAPDKEGGASATPGTARSASPTSRDPLAADAEAREGGGGRSAAAGDWRSAMLMATGSACGSALVFDLASPDVPLLHRTHAHDGATYSVAWHPFEPVLATASADATVKLWSIGEATPPAPVA